MKNVMFKTHLKVQSLTTNLGSYNDNFNPIGSFSVYFIYLSTYYLLQVLPYSNTDILLKIPFTRSRWIFPLCRHLFFSSRSLCLHHHERGEMVGNSLLIPSWLASYLIAVFFILFLDYRYSYQMEGMWLSKDKPFWTACPPFTTAPTPPLFLKRASMHLWSARILIFSILKFSLRR